LKRASPVLNAGNEETCLSGNAPCSYATGGRVATTLHASPRQSLQARACALSPARTVPATDVHQGRRPAGHSVTPLVAATPRWPSTWHAERRPVHAGGGSLVGGERTSDQRSASRRGPQGARSVGPRASAPPHAGDRGTSCWRQTRSWPRQDASSCVIGVGCEVWKGWQETAAWSAWSIHGMWRAVR